MYGTSYILFALYTIVCAGTGVRLAFDDASAWSLVPFSITGFIALQLGYLVFTAIK